MGTQLPTPKKGAYLPLSPPHDDLRKIFHGCQQIAKVPNGEEKPQKISFANG